MWLWGVIIFGILILNFGPADGPEAILNVLAFLSTFVMGAYCLVLAGVNNVCLPKKIRPNPPITAVVVLRGLRHLGMRHSPQLAERRGGRDGRAWGAPRQSKKKQSG